MKLSNWARKHGICYRTAWNAFKAGKIDGAFRLQTGAIIVPDEKATPKQECVVTYARVSSSENRDNLEEQSKRLVAFCNANGWQTHFNVKEVGSGLNDRRPKLLEVFLKRNPTKLVVEHKDRLARFGAEYIKVLCGKTGCDLIVINASEDEKEDLVQDFVSVITSFCARIYGYRRSRRKTEQLIKELEDDKKEGK